MTGAELKDLFLVLYDKVASSSAPGYNDSEIEIFLNKAQLQFVKNHYDAKKNKSKEGVEETEKRRKDLSELIRYSEPTVSQSQTGASLNGKFYDLPFDLLYTLREEATITSDDDCIDDTRISIKPVTHDEYNANIENPFKRPDETQVWRLDFSNDFSVNVTYTTGPLGIQIPNISTGAGTKRHELITNGKYTVKTYHLRYIKVPRDIKIDSTNNIFVTSELNPANHEDIVDIAVRIATGITNPQDYQIKHIEQQISE